MPLLLLAWTLLVGCGDPPVPVEEQVVPAACGTCVFQEPTAAGCYWAVRIDGEIYPVVGDVTPGHEAHQPGGMCTMEREARVAGRIEHDRLYPTTFELLPADEIPEGPPPAHEH